MGRQSVVRSRELSGSRQTPDEVDHRRVDLGRCSSWVICPQPGTMIAARSCGTNFAKSAKMCPSMHGKFYDWIAIAGDVRRRHAHQ